MSPVGERELHAVADRYRFNGTGTVCIDREADGKAAGSNRSTVAYATSTSTGNASILCSRPKSSLRTAASSTTWFDRNRLRALPSLRRPATISRAHICLLRLPRGSIGQSSLTIESLVVRHPFESLRHAAVTYSFCHSERRIFRLFTDHHTMMFLTRMGSGTRWLS